MTGHTTGQTVNTIISGVTGFTYGVNHIAVHNCNVVGYTDYLEIVLGFNDNWITNTGNAKINFHTALSKIKSKGLKGFVVFQKNIHGVVTNDKIAESVMKRLIEKGLAKATPISIRGVAYTMETVNTTFVVK